ncbi:hypothetical protein DL764_010300 [Monosporascus ibericus]|uniref:CCHC-type domain-containing protein n=1 Tax=Monosporascus ibericus TaxID=155417 RepID=A0A4V1X8Q8_9PEZI|nr:hypothetical protein DL764_010300 [Monosporascus ibericus]
MADDNQDVQGELRRLRDEIARLEAGQSRHTSTPSDNVDHLRRENTIDSAFGNTSTFRPTGMAAWPAFRKFVENDGANPGYDRKKKARANDPVKFSGNKTKFDAWAKIAEDEWKQVLRDFNVTYEKFCNRVAIAAYSNQLAYEKRQQERKPRPYDPDNDKPRNKNKNKKPRPGNSPSKPKTSSNTGKPLSEVEKKAHWEAGTYFNCGKTGHKAGDCPDKKKVAAVETAENSSSSDESGKE